MSGKFEKAKAIQRTRALDLRNLVDYYLMISVALIVLGFMLECAAGPGWYILPRFGAIIVCVGFVSAIYIEKDTFRNNDEEIIDGIDQAEHAGQVGGHAGPYIALVEMRLRSKRISELEIVVFSLGTLLELVSM